MRWKLESGKEILTVQIDNGNISTADDHGLAHDQAETSGTSSHQTDSVLQAEAGQGALEMESSSSLHGPGRGEFPLLGVLNDDCVVRSRELAFVLECSGLSGGCVLI